MEVQLGELAKQKAGSEMAKDVGEMMVKDHTKANQELKSLAAKKGVQLPAALDSQHQGMVDKVSTQSGAGFDKAYLDVLDTAHKKDIALFEKASKNAKDPEVKAFAEKTLPVLKTHHEHVKKHESHLSNTEPKKDKK